MRQPSRVGVIAIAVVLVASCRAGASDAPSVTLPRAAAAATPSAVASVMPSPSTPTASATTPFVASPAAKAIDPRTDGLDVGYGEYAITLEAAVIRPGRVTLVVHNAGQMTHGFEMKLDGSGKGGRDRLKIEKPTFGSGDTIRVEADLPVGVYEVECFVGNHASRGMRTTLKVRTDAPLVTPDPGAAVPGTVRIVQYAFVAPSIDVPAGTRVSWTNDDPAPHTVTADGGAFDSKQLDPGTGFSVVLDKAGSFSYHCDIHPTMVGQVIVH